jgi:hypothetical protein
MTYEDFVSGIRFRFVHPDTSLTTGVLRWRGLLKRLGMELDVVIAQLPEGTSAMRRRLRDVCRIPRMSTFAIAAMINEAVRRMPPTHSFVNVGVWHGFTLLAGMAGNADHTCIGVDNFSEFGGPREAFGERFRAARSVRHAFHEMDYREYFARVHQGPIGLYIYDGAHDYDNQRLGLDAAAPHLVPGSVILVDDTNDDQPRRATLDFVAANPGRYRIILDRRTAVNGHPTWWNGVIVIERR